jgi:PiT family inorganic phosphate transporter
MLLTFLLIGLAFGLYMAWNIGANDVANAMGTSVGSKALTIRQALLIAAVFEFAGAYLVGGHVTQTVKKGIVDVELFTDTPMVFVVVMLSALLSAGLWLQYATWKGLPVSTSHSIVGGVAGAGVAAAGINGVIWSKLGFIAVSWVLSPLIGAAIAFVMFRFISATIMSNKNPDKRIQKIAPFLAGLVIFILTLSMIYKGLKKARFEFLTDLSMTKATVAAALLGFMFGLVVFFILKVFSTDTERKRKKRFSYVEGHFGWLQVMTACYVAFAHGANDVANAIGPLAGIWAVYSTGEIASQVGVPAWILAFGGIGIVVGLATWGYRVMGTIGERITELTPSRGFSAEFAAASTVLLCTKLGLPISTTHTLVGAVIGVGLARGLAALDLRVMRGIVSAWVVTLPVSFGLAAGIYWTLHFLFL